MIRTNIDVASSVSRGALALALACAFVPAVSAQQAAEPVPPTPAAQANAVPESAEASSATAPAAAQDIVVTGSRVARDGSAAPTPVTALTSDALQATAPSNIPDALNKLPVFSNSSNQNKGATFSPTVAPAGNYLNLRGLGSQRMLVLLDGYRVPPTAYNSNAVDTNILPQMLVKRVDVVTGGASAAYGSDAVSGVVNFVIDRQFSGLRLEANTGTSDKGDAFSYRAGIAAGTNVGENGHIVASYQRYQVDGLSLADRGWATRNDPLTVGAGSASNPYALAFNTRLNDLAAGGLIRTGVLAGNYFRNDGTITPLRRGTATGTSIVDIGSDGYLYRPQQLTTPLKTDQVFVAANYRLTDWAEFWAQGSYARAETSFSSIDATNRSGSNRAITIFADNPYLNPTVAAAYRNAGQTSFQIGKAFPDIPANAQQSITESINVQAGLRGDFGGSWKWDISYLHGRSTLKLQQTEFDNRRFYAAVDAVRDPATGQIVCGVTLANPGYLPGCVPLNVLGSGNASAAGVAYARLASQFRAENTMDYVNANVRGDVFQLPAGALAVAVGGEVRRQKLDLTTNSDPNFLGGPTSAARAAYFRGIRGVPTNALLFSVTNIGPANGSQNVEEGYVEAEVPILKDSVIARNLSLNVAGRYTHYRTSGSVKTWKAGVSWEFVDGVRFRGTQSRDIAAPSLADLFAGPNVVTLSVTDPVTNITGVTVRTSQGNPNVKPEIGSTTVAGVVLKPTVVPRLTFSADFYRIKIRDALQTTNETEQLNSCFASNGTAPVCDLIIRPTPTSFPTNIIVGPQNLAALLVKGLDLEVSYDVPLDTFGVPGNLSLRAFGNHLIAYDTQTSPTQPVIKRAGAIIAGYGAGGLPKWTGLLSQTYSSGGFSLGLLERFTGSYRRGTTEVIAPDFAHAPNKTYVDLNVAQAIGPDRRFEIYGNIQNLFDVEPPILPSTGAANIGAPTDKAVYDVVGRYITVGARVRF